MAKDVCEIYPQPRFYRDAGEVWDVLNSTFDPQAGPNIKPREGYDARFLSWSAGQLKTMAPMDMETVLNYVEAQGWIKRKQAKGTGKDVYLINNKVPADELGEVAAVMNDVVLGGARATKALSDEFILKVQGGADAAAEGIALAKSLRAISNLGEIIMGLDQQAGRSLRARMLQKKRMVALKDKTFMTPDGREVSAESIEAAQINTSVMNSIAQNLQDPANQKKAIDDLMEIAERIKFIHDPMAIARAGLGLNFTGDMWREWFMNGLLSSPDTLAANASGALWAPMRAFAQGLGAKILQPVMNRFDDGAGDRLVVESLAKISAVNQSYQDALALGWNGLIQNRFMYADPEGAMARSITGANVEQVLGKPLADSHKDVIDKIGMVINFPSRGLQASDEIARHIGLRGEVAARAVRKAQVAGMDLGDRKVMDKVIADEFKEAFVLDPLSKNPWFYSNAYDVASALDPGGKAISNKVKEATFQEYNRLAVGINNAMPSALRPFVPFIRTPLNILNQGIRENTILGPLFHIGGAVKSNIRTPSKIIYDLQQRMLNNPADTARITGQISVMTALGAVLYNQAMQGNLTGGGPGRFLDGAEGKRAQRAWEENNVPYSFRIGKTAIPIQRLPEPAATLVRIFGDLGATAAYMDEAERDDAFFAVTMVGVTGLYNTSMLSGINELVGLLNGGIDDVDRKLGKATQAYMATQAPFSGFMAYVDRAIDPYKSAYQAPSATAFFTNWGDLFTNGVLAKAADRFPGGRSRPLQIDQIGGEPIPIQPGVGPMGLNPLLSGFPLVPRGIPSDDAWQAVYDIGMGWKDYKPSGYKLTLTEQQRLNERMGRLRIGGKTLRQRILEFRRRPEVDEFVRNRGMALEGSAAQIELELNKIKNEYGKRAMQEMSAGNVSILQRSAVYEQIVEAKRSNNVQRARALTTQLEELLERAERGY